MGPTVPRYLFMKYILLDNIRSAHNVGSIFRTADGAGVAKIFLCGYTPAPIDRFGREVAEIKKTSLGATDSVAFEQVDNIAGVIDRLKVDGVTVVAVEQTPNATPLQSFSVPESIAYVFGNEVDGVSEVALEHVDQVIEIPMLGQKESLNVSVTVGIVLFH